MRQMIKGLIAAVAVMVTAPAMACGFNPCGYSDTAQQYYYVNQGPTYTGPGNWAPRPYYREGYGRPYYGYRHYGYRHHYRPYRPHYGYRYGYAHRAPAYHYGHRVLRRYY
jgi:hypothetical protein